MSLSHEIAMALRTAYWTLHRQADACLEPLGMTANQLVILSLLAERDGVTQRELVARAASDANTLRAMLVTLERKGLVVRERHPADGRARLVTLTPKGRRTYRTLWARSEPVRSRLQAALRPDEAKRLLSLLGAITSSLVMQSQRAPRIGARAP